jgi:uncharacterized protein DUF1579
MTKGFACMLAPRLALAALLGAAAAAPLTLPALAQTGERGTAPPPRGKAQDPVVEEMAKYTTPGPRHRELAALEGKWNSRTRVWESPGAKPLEFAGSAEYRMILGGRFLQLESRSLVNGIEDHGLGIYGYDAFKEKYSFYYIHDGETQALVGLGDRDSTGAVTFSVAMDMPVAGESAKPIRTVLRTVSASRHVFEMHQRYIDDREWKVVEITYDRAR